MRFALIALLCAAAPGAGFAQSADPTVEWAASWNAKTEVKPGALGTLDLSGVVQDGWHLYALTQPPGGPTALRVSIEDNPIAGPAGSPSGTEPEHRHDPSFNLDTRFYTHSFAVHIPVALKQSLGTGKQLIPVSVRFQTCSVRECQPPRTIHLSVPIEVRSDV